MPSWSPSGAIRQSWLAAAAFFFPAVMTALLLAVVVPPFENSDEFNHAKRADQVSQGVLLARRYAGPGTSGGMVDGGIDRVDAIIGGVRFDPQRKVTGAMMRQAGAIGWGKRMPLTFANTSIYAPFFYLPSVAGVLLGKQLHLSIARTLIIARAANALTSVVLATAAIALAGEAAWLLMVLLSLPMCMSLFAAVSQDGLMIAAAAMAGVLAVRIATTHDHSMMFVALLVLLALVVLGRPSYAPFTLLPLLLTTITWRWRIIGAAATLAPLAVWSALTSRFTLINTEVHRGVAPADQLAWLAAHPGQLAGLAWHAATDRQGMEGLAFYKEFIGVLGWLDVILPAWFYDFTLGAVVLGLWLALARPAASRPVWPGIVLAAAAGGSIVLTFLLEYLTWTPVGQAWVVGVQGRYFLPVAMFLPFMLPAMRNGLPAGNARLPRVALATFPIVSGVVTIVSVVRRYYL